MTRAKSVFITLYLIAAMAGTAVAIYAVARQGASSPWLGALLVCGAPALFFTRIFVRPTPRTSRHVPLLLLAALAGSAWSIAAGGGWAAAVAVGVGLIGTPLYLFWYSRFARPEAATLRPGAALPAFTLREDGAEVGSATLTSRPALWIFYRGNWCPLCMAQIREIAGQYRALAERGVEVLLVSPQPEDNTRALAARFDVPMRFLGDPGNAAAERLGILERAGLPAGMQALGYDEDVPRPTVLLTDASGRILHADLTDNYRVRPEPAQFLAVLDRHGVGTPSPTRSAA